MSAIEEHPTSLLTRASNAMVALHKEQFGRGPTSARSHFAGPNALLCVLEDALLPAERKLVDMGDPQRVRETRLAFQVATAEEFVGAVEQIVGRKVRAFATARTSVLSCAGCSKPLRCEPAPGAYGANTARTQPSSLSLNIA